MAEGGWSNPVVDTGGLPPKETQRTSNLSFHDIVPDNHEDLRQLITMANSWLKSNPSKKVVTCEMRDVIKGSNGVDPIKSSFSLFTGFSSATRHFYRCLRLWLVDNDLSQPQEIHCMLKASDYGVSECVTFTDIIQQLNEAFKTSPLAGKILNVQTHPYKVSSDGTLDCWRTDFHVSNEQRYRYMNVVHVFYESGPPAMEVLGFADFTPNRLSKGLVSLGEFEDFSAVVEKAKAWIGATPGIHICHIETLNSKVKKHVGGEFIDTTRSRYTEDLNGATYYASFVRVIYTKSATIPPPTSPVKVFYRDFDISNDRGGKYSSQRDLLVLINEWLRTSGSRVISAGTLAISEAKTPQDTYFRITSHGKHYRFVIRIFAMFLSRS